VIEVDLSIPDGDTTFHANLVLSLQNTKLDRSRDTPTYISEFFGLSKGLSDVKNRTVVPEYAATLVIPFLL